MVSSMVPLNGKEPLLHELIFLSILVFIQRALDSEARDICLKALNFAHKKCTVVRSALKTVHCKLVCVHLPRHAVEK